MFISIKYDLIIGRDMPEIWHQNTWISQKLLMFFPPIYCWEDLKSYPNNVFCYATFSYKKKNKKIESLEIFWHRVIVENKRTVWKMIPEVWY